MSSKNRCNGAGNVRFENGSVARVSDGRSISVSEAAFEEAAPGRGPAAGAAAREALMAASEWAASRGGPLSGLAPFLRAAAVKAARAPWRGVPAVGAVVYEALSAVDWSAPQSPDRPPHGARSEALAPLSGGRTNPGDKSNYSLEDVERYGRLAGRRVANKGGSTYYSLDFLRWAQLAGPFAYHKLLAAQWATLEPGSGTARWTAQTLVSAMSQAATMADFEPDAPFREASRYGLRWAADFSGATGGLFEGVAAARPSLPPGLELKIEELWPEALREWEALERKFKQKTIDRIKAKTAREAEEKKSENP